MNACDRFACGSKSIARTLSFLAAAANRHNDTVIVDFPTPPFRLMTETTTGLFP